MVVQLLRKDVIAKVSSGQIISDLSSIVKEAIDNSIDAGASSIEIRLRNCGTEFIEVIDNGTGIDASEIELTGAKHYTSKLESMTDLSSLETLGFRGEGLNAICYVGHVTLTSATEASSPRATQVVFKETGEIDSRSIVAREKGTSVRVEFPFKGFPVRYREFSKNKKRELNKIIALVQQYSLITPSVRYRLNHLSKNNENNILISTDASSTKELISTLYGPAVARKIAQTEIELRLDVGSIKCLLYISKPMPKEGCSTRQFQFSYVNSRPVVLTKILQSLDSCYREFNTFEHPYIFLYLDVDKGIIDVNASMDKKTILLVEEEEIMKSLVENARTFLESKLSTQEVSQVHEILPKKRNASQYPLNDKNPKKVKPPMVVNPKFKSKNQTIDFNLEECIPYDLQQYLGQDMPTYRQATKDEFLNEKFELEKDKFCDMEIIGQFNKGFIIARLPDSGKNQIFIVDQHASDEAYNYEMLRNFSVIPQQKLLRPVVLNLDSASEVIAMERKDDIKEKGFHLTFDSRAKAGSRASLIQCPCIDGQLLGKDVAEQCVTVMASSGGTAPSLVQRMDRYFATKSCRMSIMIGTALNVKQMESVVKRLSQLKQPWNCPHGRPTIRHLYRGE